MDTELGDGNAAAIIRTVAELSPVEIIDAPFATEKVAPDFGVVAVPKGKELKDLRPFLDAARDWPKRIKAQTKLTSIESFSGYLNRFKNADSAVYVQDTATPSLIGIIDYHGQGTEPAPRWCSHTVSYGFPLSDAIQYWAAISGQGLTQQQFADTLFDRANDIANPPLDWQQVDRKNLELMLRLLNLVDDYTHEAKAEARAAGEEHDEEDDRYTPRTAIWKLQHIRFGSAHRLQQMARTIEINANNKTQAGFNSKTGERVVNFMEEHEAATKTGHRIIVPDAFLLWTPVFEGETPQLIPVRIQYRLVQGTVKWFLTLVAWRQVIRLAVREEVARVQADTSLPIFYGSP